MTVAQSFPRAYSPPLKTGFSRWSFSVFATCPFGRYPQSTIPGLPRYPRYNGVMRSKLMLLGFVVLLRASGCDKHPLTDYRPLDQAGMWSSNVEQLKALKTADVEVAQLVKLKKTGISDDPSVTLITTAPPPHHHI